MPRNSQRRVGRSQSHARCARTRRHLIKRGNASPPLQWKYTRHARRGRGGHTRRQRGGNPSKDATEEDEGDATEKGDVAEEEEAAARRRRAAEKGVEHQQRRRRRRAAEEEAAEEASFVFGDLNSRTQLATAFPLHNVFSHSGTDKKKKKRMGFSSKTTTDTDLAKLRIPSFPDKIMVSTKGRSLFTTLYYNVLDEVTGSDHRPVLGIVQHIAQDFYIVFVTWNLAGNNVDIINKNLASVVLQKLRTTLHDKNNINVITILSLQEIVVTRNDPSCKKCPVCEGAVHTAPYKYNTTRSKEQPIMSRFPIIQVDFLWMWKPLN